MISPKKEAISKPKRKIIVPQNIISFRQQEKPKVAIVRKVYVKKSRELMHKVAETDKIRCFMDKVSLALTGL